MRSLECNFGYNAGKIWKILERDGALNDKEIIKKTDLSSKGFYSGLGWLARENKIFEECDSIYRLGDTNLSLEIGTNAGKIWKIMDIWGEVNTKTIMRLSELKENEVYSALGWLAREDKIKTNENELFDLK